MDVTIRARPDWRCTNDQAVEAFNVLNTPAFGPGRGARRELRTITSAGVPSHQLAETGVLVLSEGFAPHSLHALSRFAGALRSSPLAAPLGQPDRARSERTQ